MSRENSHSVLGLEHGVVRLSDYTSSWADLYREEEERIKAAVAHLIIDLQHIGSTAIPRLKRSALPFIK